MKLDSSQIERALSQFDAEVIPEEHPVIEDLKDEFGNHTYFLDQTGLNIVEPADADENSGKGVVMNIADWTDGGSPRLRAHAPEVTGLLVTLDA
jgi:hypothetical protein